MKGRWVKGILTVSGAVLLSTLGIFASDTLRGVDSQLGNLSGSQKNGVCRVGSSPVRVGEAVICVDLYEASPSEECPHDELNSTLHSEQNVSAENCYAASVAGAIPWNFISLPQAQRVCATSGKRLPTSKEWYQFALGTDPEKCIIDSPNPDKAGTPECIATSGVHDAVGNLWEWVNESVVGNTFDNRTLPQEGYVTSVDAYGVAITSAEAPDDLYGKDYLWSKEDGVFGMIRGGFYGSKQDAGLYTINASVPTSFASKGVGFRCVEDVL